MTSIAACCRTLNLFGRSPRINAASPDTDSLISPSTDMTFSLRNTAYRVRGLSNRPRLWLLCGGFTILITLVHSIHTWSHGYRGWTAVGGRLLRNYSQWRGLTSSSFAFQSERPTWLQPLSSAPMRPIVMRIAVLSAAEEFETRDFLRKAVYNASRIPSEELVFEYKFFVGQHGEQIVDDAIQLESNLYGDLSVVDTPESKWALSVKRFEALQWVSRSAHGHWQNLLDDIGTFRLRQHKLKTTTSSSRPIATLLSVSRHSHAE